MGSFRKIVVAVLLGFGWYGLPAHAVEPVQVLILTGESDLPYHDWRVSTPFLRKLLEQTGRFTVKVLEQPRGITAATLRGFDLLVLNYNGPRWGEATEAAVESFVRGGKGMISFHGVSYGPFFGQVKKGRWEASPTGDRGWVAYARMLGARWKPENIGHSARHVYTVKWTDPTHPIAKGLPPTFVANDELYHRLDLLPAAHVLATAYSDPSKGGTGRAEPQIWTVPYGQGRTVHLTLGHDLAAMIQPGFLAAFARGAEWAATGTVSLPAEIAAPGAPVPNPVRVLVVTGGHSYPAKFYSLFEGYRDLVWDHATTSERAFTPDMGERYDAVVLHDMREDLPAAQRANLRAFVEAGNGVVSIHHAIVDYTKWSWWYEEVIGGKYFVKATGGHAASHFKEGRELIVTPVAKMRKHPVLRGVGPIPVRDEAYRGMWYSPKITVLMETGNELNDRPVVYLGPNKQYRAVYIQLGHGAEVMRHPGYRRLVRNAIDWAAGR